MWKRFWIIIALLSAISHAAVAAPPAASSQRPPGPGGCPPGAPGVERWIEQFRDYPLEVVDLGAYRVYPNRATKRVVRFGLGAVEALLRASQGEDRVVAIYSVFSLGEILQSAGTRSPAARACRELAASVLQELVTGLGENARNLLDFTLLGTAREALEKIGIPQEGQQAPARCCVTNVEIVTAGQFQGGKTLNDYYPDLVGGGFWQSNNTGGPFDTGSRAGAAMQFVATCTGDRSRCRFTQHYTVPQTTFPGEAVTNTPVDDIARSGRDQSRAPFRQDIGNNQTSFADPASYTYNAGNRANFEATNVFVSCALSSDRSCSWDRCCIQWTWKVKVQGGAVSSNTLGADRKWCEKAF